MVGPGFFPTELIVAVLGGIVAVPLGCALILRWVSRSWSRPIGLLESVALWLPLLSVGFLFILSPPIAAVLLLTGVTGAVSLIRRWQKREDLGGLAMMWFATLALMAVSPWLIPDVEGDMSTTVLAPLFYLSPLFFAGVVTARASRA